MLGDRHVVDHRTAGHGQVLTPDHPTVATDDAVLDELGAGPEVVGRVQLSRHRIQLRVRRVAVRQRAVEVAAGDRRELVVELDGLRPRFHQCVGASTEADDVRVGRAVHALGDRPARIGFAQLVRHRPRADPAVAVPLGTTLTQPDAVHHAAAREPVVVRRIGVDRVRSVAQVAAVEHVRQGALDGQVDRRDLLGHRREVPLEVRIGQRRRTPRCSVEIGHPCTPCVAGRPPTRTVARLRLDRLPGEASERRPGGRAPDLSPRRRPRDPPRAPRGHRSAPNAADPSPGRHERAAARSHAAPPAARRRDRPRRSRP